MLHVLATIKKKNTRTGAVAQVVHHLPSKQEALNSTPVTTKRKPVIELRRILVQGQTRQIACKTLTPK
jgi:hypothetical protein